MAGYAQSFTNFNLLPVVTIRATDPLASFAGDTATFTVFREGNTNAALDLYYRIGGTASNGVDYASITNTISIPAGARSNTITISPIDLGQTAAETVELKLFVPSMESMNYMIGVPYTAMAYIQANGTTTNIGTNLPPVVRLTSPFNNAAFRAPVNIPLYAYGRDLDGSVVSVEFFEGTNSLGFGIHPSLGGDNWTMMTTNMFVLVWSNAPVGTFTLTATATDDRGASTVSAPAQITILPSQPSPTNLTPLVSIVATEPVAIAGTNSWVTPVLTNWFGMRTNGSWPVMSFLTNSGPKNATFTVRRYGSTNQDLTVTYAIGGTATNGVDYATLPGSIMIPAGQRQALISVVPLEDGAPALNRTVVLKLTASTNYTIGFPARAAALIEEGYAPHDGAEMLADHSFHFTSEGPDGAWFHVESSTNMLNWTSICTNQVINGSMDFIDPDGQTNQFRFYRTVPESVPAP